MAAGFRLTTKDAVLSVLKAGGCIVVPGPKAAERGMPRLYDAGGREVDAWLTAINANMVPSKCTTEATPERVTWRLR